jgi:hypothetical protein
MAEAQAAESRLGICVVGGTTPAVSCHVHAQMESQVETEVHAAEETMHMSKLVQLVQTGRSLLIFTPGS